MPANPKADSQASVRIGLVGAGRWGRNYIKTARSLDTVDLVGVASGNPQTRSLVGPTCRVVGNWARLLEDDGIEGLIIATPPAAQVEIALAALGRGVPVLLEKPMALSTADARRIVDRSRATGTAGMVDHVYLFNPAFQALLSAVGAVDDVVGVRAEGGAHGPFRDDFPTLWDWAPHDVAMCLALFGDAPQDVTCREREGVSPGELFDIDLSFAGGRTANLTLGNGFAAKVRRFTVTLRSGAELVFDDVADDRFVRVVDGQAQVVEVDAEAPLTRAVRMFGEGVRAGGFDISDLAFGLKVVDVIARRTG